MWCRNDSETGYLLQFDLYKDRKENKEVGLGENVIIKLSGSSVCTNVRLFFQNFFTSPSLIYKLKEEQIHACGTVCQNRRLAKRFEG